MDEQQRQYLEEIIDSLKPGWTYPQELIDGLMLLDTPKEYLPIMNYFDHRRVYHKFELNKGEGLLYIGHNRIVYELMNRGGN